MAIKKTTKPKSKKRVLDGAVIPDAVVTSYAATIKVLGKIYLSTGITVKEALENLKPALGKGVSILTISHDGTIREKIIPPLMTQKLFSPSRITREIAIKNTSLLFT